MILFSFLFGCSNRQSVKEQKASRQLQQVNALLMSGQLYAARDTLKRIRRLLSPDDPVITDYYLCYLKTLPGSDVAYEHYADSLLAFFSVSDRQVQYRDRYYKALFVNGEMYRQRRQYKKALDLFYRSRQLLSDSICDTYGVVSKIALIYYQHGDYRGACREFVYAYHKANRCPAPDARASFMKAQDDLNNIIQCYNRLNLLDSAAYYSAVQEELIRKGQPLLFTDTCQLSNCRITSLGNLAEMELRRGHTHRAEQYLQQSLSLWCGKADAPSIRPNIQLAALYLQTCRPVPAADALRRAKKLLDRYPDAPPETMLEWNRQYSAYLEQTGQYAVALAYREKYYSLRDSLVQLHSDYYYLDMRNELDDANQRQLLIEYNHHNQISRIYLISVSAFCLLAIVIAFLIRSSLLKSKRLNRETVLYNDQLLQTLAELELANKNNRRIMWIMAHDLRNPVSGMVGLAHLLEESGGMPEEKVHLLQLIQSTGQQSILMLEDLLKTGTGTEEEVQTMVKKPQDLKDIIRNCIRLLQFRADEKEQKIVFDQPAAPVIVPVNYEKLLRVLNNIIVNAIKFSYMGGIIRVQLREQETTALIAISDEGTGIAEADKADVFEMFTHARREGTSGEKAYGLGLSICKKIIEKHHHGRIWFESEREKGTTFFIELPLRDAGPLHT